MKILELEEDKAEELAEWIEFQMFEEIRNDHSVDSILWIDYWLNIIRTLRDGNLV